MLKKSLSCSYPNLPFNKALQKENEKLQLELQRSQANLNVGECEVIQRLISVTESVAATSRHEKHSPERVHKVVENTHVDANNGHSSDESYYKNNDTQTTSRSAIFHFQHFNYNHEYRQPLSNTGSNLALNLSLMYTYACHILSSYVVH